LTVLVACGVIFCESLVISEFDGCDMNALIELMAVSAAVSACASFGDSVAVGVGGAPECTAGTTAGTTEFVGALLCTDATGARWAKVCASITSASGGAKDAIDVLVNILYTKYQMIHEQWCVGK